MPSIAVTSYSSEINKLHSEFRNIKTKNSQCILAKLVTCTPGYTDIHMLIKANLPPRENHTKDNELVRFINIHLKAD